jgi:hypothetical protein
LFVNQFIYTIFELWQLSERGKNILKIYLQKFVDDNEEYKKSSNMEFEAIESSQKQHHNEINHQMNVELLETEQQYKRFAMLKPKIYKDGNEWCVLYGENIIEGVAGFGNTPHQAVIDWEANWNSQA